MFGFSLVRLGIYAAIALAVVAALAWGYHSVKGVGKAEQLAVDTPIIDGLQKKLAASETAERQREAETASCVAAGKVQTQAVLDAKAITDKAQQTARAAIAKARADGAKSEMRIAELRKMAAAPRPVVTATCAETLSATDAILRESVRERRKP